MYITLKRCMESPRRRFMFGYTVTDDMMELWYFDPANAIVSEPLAWISDVSTSISVHIEYAVLMTALLKPADQRVMVHFFLVMLYTDVPTSFGWDPTVQLVREMCDNADVQAQYDYTVEDSDGTQTVYRTLGLLAEPSDSDSKKALCSAA